MKQKAIKVFQAHSPGILEEQVNAFLKEHCGEELICHYDTQAPTMSNGCYLIYSVMIEYVVG